MLGMADVTIRDLRNHVGAAIDRVEAGEHLTVTRSGRPVAELRPLSNPRVNATALLERWRHLPHVDPGRFRADLDTALDPSL